MYWVRSKRGKNSIKALRPFPGCSKAQVFKRDVRKRCSRWVYAEKHPDLWTPERIARDCAPCHWWKG